MPDDSTIDRMDALDGFLKFADNMREIHERYNRPAWSETCACGASSEVSKEVPKAERARIWRTFIGRHQYCTETTTALAPVLGQVGSTEEEQP